MAALPPRLEDGAPYPLGATWDGLGANFAVFSEHATAMELCLFQAAHGHEIARLPMPRRTDQVWHGYLAGVQPGLLYGYRAHGVYEPEAGHRFNPNKLLLDPYARRLAGTLRWTDTLFGYRTHSPRVDVSFDRRDSGPAMVKAQLAADNFHWGDDRPPNVPWSDTVIYEAHVKGLTQLLDAVGASERGSYAALGRPAVIDHLRKIGITALELLPVHAFLQDRELVKRGLTNYWGYNTLSYFAVEQRYARGDAADELRTAIRQLHAAGIEVILDVVYNHTCEGSELGPTLSWRGLDNASYYRLVDGDRRRCVNDTGTGNALNLTHPRVIQMVMDSLRYFVESFHIDGFRFDLAAALGREDGGFDSGCGFFDALRQDPLLARVKLIAEPWDVGPGGYQLGNHPPGFAEWNDKYRDTLRRYWRGDAGQRPELASRLAGSEDVFGARGPRSSINYVASHDGAPLSDLVTYEGKYNDANGEDNRDGIGDNIARNWGVEGETDRSEILAMRERVKRSLLTSLFVSLGTPMLLAGDEFGRTQRGNNNAYCQDNEISWLDWQLASREAGISLISYVRRLAALRRRYASLRRDVFLRGESVTGDFRDLGWLDERNVRLAEDDWPNPGGRALVMRRAERRGDGCVDVLAFLMNGGEDAIDFALPEHLDWRVLIDSADPAVDGVTLDAPRRRVEAHACALLVATIGMTPPDGEREAGPRHE
jgi:glycogen operon protein